MSCVGMSSRFNIFEEALDFSFWRELCEKHGTMRHFRRGEYFARTGEVLRNAGWIVSGGFKHSLIDNSGNAKTVGFVFGCSVLANYISSMHGKKMPTDIIALEVCDFPGSLYREKSRCSIIATVPCEIHCIPSAEVAKLMQGDDKVRQIVEVSTRELFYTLYDRHVDLYSKSPQQRYDELFSRDPDLFQLFSLKDIASLLNITPPPFEPP